MLAPVQIINPWKVVAPSNRDLPSTTMRSLIEAKRQMDVTQEKMRDIVLEEIKTSPERFRQGRVKLSSNKTSPPAIRGDIVLTELPNQTPELGYVEFADTRNVTLRRADGRRVQLPLAACTVTSLATLDSEMASRENGQFTHFISLECQKGDEWGPFREEVQRLQDEIAQVFNTGKRVKVDSLHLTLGTLLLHPEEIEKIQMEL